MTDPVQFPSVTPRHGLPLLFAGQAQKEFFVNAAFALADALLHPLIESVIADPPAEPDDGQCWLIAPEATGVFAGKTDSLAIRQTGGWRFAEPTVGMRVYDSSTRQFLIYHTQWTRGDAIEPPNGGSVVDSEARAAIGGLVEALKCHGILPQN